MLDIKELRKNPEEFEKKLQSKDPSINLNELLKLDEEVRALKTSLDELKSEKNKASKEFGEKKKNKEDTEDLGKRVQTLKEQISEHEEKISESDNKVLEKFASLPNLPFQEIPISESPSDNVCIKTVGKKREFSFPFKNHVELNESLNLFDFVRGAKIAGSGFPLYKGLGAELEWALLNYMLEIHRKNGFTQVIPPLLAKEETLYGSAQLPKFESQLFKIKDDDFHLYLIPTAEVSINGMHLNETLDEKDLPLLYTGYTPCFRREAGAAGASERGLIRTHQFNKVEMFVLSTPETSEEMFQKMMDSAEEILQGLELHYRNMLLVTGDMSFAAAKTVDIEAWLPGQNRYMEVSSVSNCTDFQARRSKTKFRRGAEKPEFLHTLNGSGLATSRLMVALLENNQQEDGSVLIPKVLHKYLGKEVLSPHEKNR